MDLRVLWKRYLLQSPNVRPETGGVLIPLLLGQSRRPGEGLYWRWMIGLDEFVVAGRRKGDLLDF